MNNRPSVILSAGHITHYHHAALALQNAGWLKRYLYSFGLHDLNSPVYNLLPAHTRARLRGRSTHDLDPKLVRNLPLAEITRRFLSRVRFISPERSEALYSTLFDLSSLPFIHNCDVYHFVNNFGFYSGQKAKKLGCTVICDMRSAHCEHERRLVEEEYERLKIIRKHPGAILDGINLREYGIADYMIVPSDYVRATFVEAGVPEERIFIVPYGVSLDTFGYEDEIGRVAKKRSPFRVLYVGGIIPRKGVHYLIEAFQRFEPPDAELVLVGNILNEMIPLIEKATNNDGRIRHYSHIPHIELHEIYRQAAVFVLPTVSEGSARVVYEAMAAGVPVITTPNAGSIVEDNLSGFIVPLRNVDAITHKLWELYENPSLGNSIGDSAHERAKKYSWDFYCKRLISVYQEISSS